jgi:hypothetical protein
MAMRAYLCGSSNSIYNAPLVRRVTPAAQRRPMIPPADRDPVRLRTRLHLGAARPTAADFRVLAVREDGDTALVCLGATRGEVVAGARGQTAGLAREAVSLLLQQWVGGRERGRWQTLPLRRGELPVLRQRGLRRRECAALLS